MTVMMRTPEAAAAGMRSFAARRMSGISVSPMGRLLAKTVEMRAAGRKVVNLGIGEPDFDTPAGIQDAAIQAVRGGATRYTPVDGTTELKKAVAAKFRRENGLAYEPGQITIGAGAKQLIFNAIMSTVDEGDEVIIPAPYWSSYVDIVAFAGGKPVFVECPQSAGFKLRPADLERAITPRTKWLMLNSPSNPTGAAYTGPELGALAAVLLRHPQVWAMSDDIYEHLVFDDFKFTTIAQVEPRLLDRTLTINGVSKSYCMTGWRIGYAGGPATLIRMMSAVQSQATSNPSSISQAAAVAALNGPQDDVPRRSAVFQERRDAVLRLLNADPLMPTATPEGAFYLYPSCAGYIGRRTPDGKAIATDLDFVEYLLEAEGVAVVHGAAFGLSPHFRISIAASRESLEEACMLIRRACARLV